MKKKFLSIVLSFISLSLVSCSNKFPPFYYESDDVPSTSSPDDSGNTSKPEEEKKKPTIEDVSLQVEADLSYKVSFVNEGDVSESQKYYLSSDDKYDEQDNEIDVTKGENNTYSFTYGGNENSFYFFILDQGEILTSSPKVTLPYLNGSVTTENGKDKISFSSFSSDGFNAFDASSVDIYRSDKDVFDYSLATRILADQTISNNVIEVDHVDGEDNYFFVATMDQGKVDYLSQVIKTDNTTLDGSVNYSSASVSQEGILTIQGVDNSNGKFRGLAFGSKDNPTTKLFDLVSKTKAGSSFEATFDLKTLDSDYDTEYQVYSIYNGGNFTTVDNSILSSFPADIENNYFSFSKSNSSALGFNLTKKSVFVVNEAKMSLDSQTNEPIFEVTGSFHKESLKGELKNPVLVIYNDEKGTYDGQEFPVEVTGDTFSVKANMKGLNRYKDWYWFKLYTNNEKVEGQEHTYKEKVDNVIKASDVKSDYDKVLTYAYRGNTYQFMKDGNIDILRMVLNDTIDVKGKSLNFIKKNGRVYARLEGTTGPLNKYVFRLKHAQNEADAFSNEFTADEKGNFVCDVDITGIKVYTNETRIMYTNNIRYAYNDEFKVEFDSNNSFNPTSLLADDNGFIYCIRYDGSSRWWKIAKDNDNGKVNDFNFANENNKAILKLTLNVNSKVADQDLYFALVPNKIEGQEEAPWLSQKVTLDENRRFAVSMDISSMKKGYRYDLTLVNKAQLDAKNGSICQFYPDHYPEGMDFVKEITTAEGTYRMSRHTDQGINYVSIILS